MDWQREEIRTRRPGNKNWNLGKTWELEKEEVRGSVVGNSKILKGLISCKELVREESSTIWEADKIKCGKGGVWYVARVQGKN